MLDPQENLYGYLRTLPPEELQKEIEEAEENIADYDNAETSRERADYEPERNAAVKKLNFIKANKLDLILRRDSNEQGHN
jgi:hypothetical protein